MHTLWTKGQKIEIFNFSKAPETHFKSIPKLGEGQIQHLWVSPLYLSTLQIIYHWMTNDAFMCHELHLHVTIFVSQFSLSQLGIHMRCVYTRSVKLAGKH